MRRLTLWAALILTMFATARTAQAADILTCYTGQNFSGTSCTSYGTGNSGGYMNTLTASQLNNQIRSFKLKKGYMVTFAVGTAGWGYSRCFVADNADLEMSSLPCVLDGKISSYRIFEWQTVRKNGLASNDATANNAVSSSWCFTWGVGSDMRPNQECVPHKIQKWWPGVAEIGQKNYSAHMKTDNEPANYIMKNPAFSWGTATLSGGDGSSNYPYGWTFIRTTSGWNDHNVAKESINGVDTYRFNSWAGTITKVELLQTLTNLPNGIYRLTADLATTDGLTRTQTRTAIYGAPIDADYIGRSYNIEGKGDSNYLPYEVLLQVNDGTMNIGVRSDGTWFKIANFNLTYLGPTASATDQQKREAIRGRALQKWFFGQTQGDVNLDLRNTISDIPTLIDIMRGNQPDYGPADQNNDKQLNNQDVQSLKNLILSQ